MDEQPCICHMVAEKLDSLDKKLDSKLDRLEDKIDKRLTRVEQDVQNHDKKISKYAGGLAVIVFAINIIMGAIK